MRLDYIKCILISLSAIMWRCVFQRPCLAPTHAGGSCVSLAPVFHSDGAPQRPSKVVVGGIWQQLGDRGQNTDSTQTLVCSSSQHAHPHSPVTEHLFPMGLDCTCHTSQLYDLAHCLVFSGSVFPTCPFYKDVVNTSMCRRPESHSGTHRTGGGPFKTTALVLTAVTGEEAGPGRGLEYPYISLAGDAGQAGNAGRGTSAGREEDIHARPICRGKENFFCTKGSVSSIPVAFW